MIAYLCNICGSRENWCLDRFDQVWVRCSNDSCETRRQYLMFEVEPQWDSGVPKCSEGDEPYDTVRTLSSNKAPPSEEELPF